MGLIGISSGIEFIMIIICTIIGAVVTGTWQGALIGLILPLIASLICVIAFVPFCGAWFFWQCYPIAGDWLLSVTNLQVLSPLVTGNLWVFGIIGIIITILTSIAAVAFLIGGMALLAKLFS